jgi:hypothetical protein
MKSFKQLRENKNLHEGKMKEFHEYMKQGKKPEWIAKKMGLDLATVKELIQNESIDESVDLEEKAQTFKSLEDWIMAVLSKPGRSITKFGNNLSAQGLGRMGSATFELKKGRGSLVESVDLEEGKKPVSQMTPAEKKADAERRKEYKAYQKSKRESVDEGAEVYTMKKGAYTRKVDGKESDKMKKQGWKLVAREGLGEARKDSAADLYFDTYSAAVQHAAAQAEKKGFEVVEDDWFNQVTTGKGKPGRGKTTRHTLKLTKGGKPVRQSLSIQVYNRDTGKKPYELNSYVS